MSLSVLQAFKKFINDHIDIDPELNRKAKASRDWLLEKISDFDGANKFVTLYKEVSLAYGSYARKTKVPPLDDIDLMIGLHASGCTYLESYTSSQIVINVPNGANNLLAFKDDTTGFLNSRKIINAFVSTLEAVPQYSKADVKRNQQACTLTLASLPWTYDIVPAFFTTPDLQGRSYYLIPDGKGHWMKSDPRIDNGNIATVDQTHNNRIRRLIRLVKFWQRRPTMPTMRSYLLEVLILDYYRNRLLKASEYPDWELPGIFQYIGQKILYDVADPKGISSNINDLNPDERHKIATKANEDFLKGNEARQLESSDKMKESISKWTEIFGDSFPKYE